MEEVYARRHRTLAALNVDLIRHLWVALGVPTKLHLQSELGVGGQGADLLANVCEALKADWYLALTVAAKYIDPPGDASTTLPITLACSAIPSNTVDLHFWVAARMRNGLTIVERDAAGSEVTEAHLRPLSGAVASEPEAEDQMARARTVFLVVMGFLATAAAASAQDIATSFDALAGRIQVGQQIWVTDTTGREVRGRLERLSSDGLVLKANDLETFTALNIRRVRARARDSLKNGTLIGLGIGGGMGTAWCIGAIADDSGDIDARVECAEGFTVFPGLGALIGLAVDAVIPKKLQVVYQASPPREASRASVMVVPLFSSHAKGLAVSLAF